MQESVSNTKPKMSVKKKIVIGLLCLVLAGVLFFIGVIVQIAVTPRSALNVPSSMGYRTGVTSIESENSGVDKTWYTTPRESLEVTEGFTDEEYLSETLFERAGKGKYLMANFYKTAKGNTGFVMSRFEVQDGLYSSPLSPVSYTYTELRNKSDRYTYETERERVVEHITSGMFDNLMPAGITYPYAGVSTYPTVKTLTILGMSPTDIIEYEYEGITYYFWYYDFDFNTYLSEHKDFDFSDFTRAQLIDVLKIEVEEPVEE